MRTALHLLPALLAAALAAPLAADTPAAAPAPAAPAPSAAPADTGWSSAPATPAAAPLTAAATPAAPLRPPVVRRGRSAAAAAPAMAPAAPSAITSVAPAAAQPAPALPTPVAAPAAPAAAAAPASSAPIVERMPQGPVPGAVARVLQVSKEHNVALDDGTLALGLRTTFTVDAFEGGSFRVWVSFTDRATGLPIRSTRPSFAKADGQAHVVTQPVASIAPGDTFDAPLLVPYEIFPNPGAGQSTEVQALVEVTREAGGGREVVVATALTTFRVHGS